MCVFGRVVGGHYGIGSISKSFFYFFLQNVTFSIFCDILLLVVSLSTRKENADFSDIDSWRGDDTTFL